MTTAYTSLLGLALPTTGELQGTWGDTVNNSITSLLDSAVAGTTTLSTDGDVTLTTTTGAANQARQAILLCTGARTAVRTITAPAQSKIYTIINATTGGFAVKIIGVGPTTGISIPAGQTAVVAWNGSDFVDASNYFNGNATINGNLTVNGNTTLKGNTSIGDATSDTLSVTSTITSNLLFTDNTYDIGASGATRPKNLYLAGFALIGTGTSSATLYLDADTAGGSSNQVYFRAAGTNKWALGGGNIGIGGANDFALYNYVTSSNSYIINSATNTTTFYGLMGIGAAPASGYTLDITKQAASSNVLVRTQNTTESEDVGYVISGKSSSTQYDYSVGMNVGENSPYLQFWNTGSASAGYRWFVNGTRTATMSNSSFSLNENLLFDTDATYNIGASGANRPNMLYVANNITAGQQIASITSGSVINFLAQCSQSSGYASLRLYNDQNSSVRSLEIDYMGTTSTSGLTGGPTGEQATIGTTGAYPMIFGTANTARMWFSGTSTQVGIGRAPTSILDVYGVTPTLTIAASDNNSRALLSATAKTNVGAAVTTVVGSIGDGLQGAMYTTTNHPLTFATNNAAPQMALTTAGKLALSASTPQTYGGTAKLYIDSTTQNAASITLAELNTIAGANGSIFWQAYYNGTTTLHDSMQIRRYNAADGNDNTYSVYMDFLLRPAGVDQSPTLAGRMTARNGGCLILGNSSGTNAYDANLYVYRSVSNITNGNQEGSAAVMIGSTETTSNAAIFMGSDQGTNKYGYIGVIQKGTAYLPLLLNPVGGAYVGIGTGVSMPAYNLDVWGSSPGLRVKATQSSGGAQLLLDCGASAGYSNQVVFSVNGSSYWALGGKDIGSASGTRFSIYNYTTSSNAFTIQDTTNLTSINSASAEAMLYVNTGGYAMTSGQAGAFLLVTGSSRPCIEVASQASGQDAAYRTVSTNGSTWSGWTVGINIETGSDILSWCYNSGQAAKIYSASGGVQMRLTTGGALSTTTGSLGTISDIRMKKNVADATPKLDQLMQLRVVNYTLIDDPQERKMLGFVAQEIEQVFPGLVEEFEVRDPETKEITMMQKTVKTTVLIPMLVKAMQELKAEFDAYKASHP